MRKGQTVPSKTDYEVVLNHAGPPDHDHPANGGRVSWANLPRYGTWLRRCDPIAFEVGYNEYIRERKNT